MIRLATKHLHIWAGYCPLRDTIGLWLAAWRRAVIEPNALEYCFYFDIHLVAARRRQAGRLPISMGFSAIPNWMGVEGVRRYQEGAHG